MLENPPYDDVEANTLSAMAAQYAKMPSVAGALKTAALTPRDFAKFVLAVSRAAMISGVQKQESRWRYPPVFRRRTSRLPRIMKPRSHASSSCSRRRRDDLVALTTGARGVQVSGSWAAM